MPQRLGSDLLDTQMLGGSKSALLSLWTLGCESSLLKMQQWQKKEFWLSHVLVSLLRIV